MSQKLTIVGDRVWLALDEEGVDLAVAARKLRRTAFELKEAARLRKCRERMTTG